MVHNNTETIYNRRYSTIVGHYNTEGTVQQLNTILQMVHYNSGTLLQKEQYNSGTLYYRRNSTIEGQYNTEGTVQQWNTILQKEQYNSGTL